MDRLYEILNGLPIDFTNVYIALLRLAAPALMVWILWRAGRPLLTHPKEKRIWAVLRDEKGVGREVSHWENVIGSDELCDIVLRTSPTPRELYESERKQKPAAASVRRLGRWLVKTWNRLFDRRDRGERVERNHAVLTRYEDGSWSVSAVKDAYDLRVNGRKGSIFALEPGDTIGICGRTFGFEPFSEHESASLERLRGGESSGSVLLRSVLTLLLLTLLQLMCALGYLLNGDQAHMYDILLGFGGICAAQWVLLLFYILIHRVTFEAETVAFFLCTMGMNVIASTVPGETVKQLLALAIGLVVFLTVGWCLRDLDRAKLVRYLACAAGVGFLVVTLLFGREIHGAKNWLFLGGFSIQPSELSKLCFVFVGASTMDRIMQKRNLIGFILYSALMCGLLALMNDFGTALIFFVTFLSIAYMRSGSMGTIALACSALAYAGILLVRIAPHALRRFEIWRHIWEEPLGRGYQQTRSLMCMASGGMFGLGAGNGWMRKLFASDTDVVFATVGEEWGLIAALATVAAVAILAFFCLRSASSCRSSFYAIGGCTAACILMAQTILNVLGTVDLLPFTGVTFPFVSNGGSSMISAWGLMAFVKALDTRPNASFAIRTLKKNREVTE